MLLRAASIVLALTASAAAAQARLFNFLDDVFRLHFEPLFQGLISAVLDISFETAKLIFVVMFG